jgi:hypothetical protein
MRAYWEARDPIERHEKFLMSEKLLDAKGKKEIEEKINTLLAEEREFAENSPMPPPELAEKGVYCTGDNCHKIVAKWERPLAEVTPPKSSVEPVWMVEGYGKGKGASGANAPIHFGDTPADKAAEESKPASRAIPKTSVKKLAKVAAPKPAASRKARR